LITVGIPSYNREHSLSNLIIQLAEQNVWNFISRLIVVYSGDYSKELDKAIAFSRGRIGKITIHQEEEPRGLVAAHNSILGLCTSRWLMRLNDDLRIPINFLNDVQEFMKDVGENFLGYGWMFRGEDNSDDYWNDKLNTPYDGFLNWVDLNKRKIHSGQIGYAKTRGNYGFGQFLYGAGFVYDADLAKQIGAYNPSYFNKCALHEEVDLGLRMWAGSFKKKPFVIKSNLWVKDLNPPQSVENDVQRRPKEQTNEDKEKIKKHEEKLWETWRTWF